jgi:hypothetical protein
VTFRLAVRIGAMVIAVMVAAGAILLATEIALALAGQRHLVVDGGVWNDRGRTLAWSEASNLALAALLLAIGVALLLLAWWPRRPEVLAASVPIDEVGEQGGTGAGPLSAPVSVSVRRRDLEATLARAARRVDAVTDASVRIKKGSARVEAATARREVADLPERVRTAVDAQARRLAVDLQVPPVRMSSRDNT